VLTSCISQLTPFSPNHDLQEVAAWEGRGAFLYNVDAGGDIAAQALTLGHLAHIWARAGLSFSLVRPGAPATCNEHFVPPRFLVCQVDV
jgi:hypothetical protein